MAAANFLDVRIEEPLTRRSRDGRTSGTFHLTSASSRSTLSCQSMFTLVDGSSSRNSASDIKYNTVEDLSSFPTDTRLTLVNEEEQPSLGRRKQNHTLDENDYDYDDLTALPSPVSWRDEERGVSLINNSALTSTGNLLLEKSAATPLPPALTDPASTESDALPQKYGTRAYRYLRWTFFSTYRRLFSIIFTANLAVLIGLLGHGAARSLPFLGLSYNNTLDACAANLLLAILTRHEHVVNLLFWLSTLLSPKSTPLWLRRNVAKIYSYGGVHSGCAIAATVWYVAFTGLATRNLVVPITGGAKMEPVVVALSYIIVLLFITIACFAHPRLRSKFHNHFEATHRFAGWTAVAIFWAQTILVAHFNSVASHSIPGHQPVSLGYALLISVPFWCLILITLCIIYPWTRLRLRPVIAEPLGDPGTTHAIRLHFNHAQLDYCMGVRLTDDPLLETHAFAAIPNIAPNPDLEKGGLVQTKGFSVVISNAGDWTKRIITNPPEHIYVKGAPTFGVLRVAVVFDPVVVVATGSGIGPCLSLFHGRPDLNVRILWSTPSPLATYGQGIIDGVLRADPNAVIVDTRAGPKDANGKPKRPDMVRLTYNLWKESGAEAVVIISNPVVTRKVVYGLETRGVPAYGPIFDS